MSACVRVCVCVKTAKRPEGQHPSFLSSSACRTVIQRYGKQKSSNINHLASRCCPLKRRRPNICLPLHLNTRLRGGRVVTVHPQYEIIPSSPGNHIKSEFVCSARIRLSPALAICYAAHPLSVCVCLSVCLSVCLCVSVCLSVSLSLSVSVCLSLSLCLSLCLCLCLSLSLSLSLSTALM